MAKATLGTENDVGTTSLQRKNKGMHNYASYKFVHFMCKRG